MEQFLDISKGIGLALAAGMSPLPALLVAGLLARGNLGVSFDDADYSFIQEWFFLIAVAGIFALLKVGKGLMPNVRQRFVLSQRVALIAVGMGAGALLFAGALADNGYAAWPGLMGGALVALLGSMTQHAVLSGAGRRLEGSDDIGLLEVVGDVSAIGVLAAVVLFPPLSYPAVASVIWLQVVRRRQKKRKYQGLRILR